jgi:sulfotransferase
MKINFISGLPRSGSTLLTALLKQNPKFHASISSPVFELFWAAETAMGRDRETSVFISDKTRIDILKGLFDSYYKDNPAEVIFDTSRMWCARVPVLASLFPEAKFICCVREVGWIIDSFERLYRKNGQVPSALYNWNTNGTVWSRAKLLTEPEGVVGYSYNAVQEAIATEEALNRVMVLDYEDLCIDPVGAIDYIYQFINEDKFEHDFENFHFSTPEFDKFLGAENLHTVNGPVFWKPRSTILPLPLFYDVNKNNFWRTNRIIPEFMPEPIVEELSEEAA